MSTFLLPSPPCREIPVLLVDDDPSFRLGLSGALGDDGHQVLAFALPAEVPEGGRLLDVTLLVTDYEMPGENGVAFADRFHAARPDVPVVLMTAFRTYVVEAQPAVRPYLTVLSKPLDYDQFHVLLHELMASGPLATR
jgi:DNA-binding NtrC family response regulator